MALIVLISLVVGSNMCANYAMADRRAHCNKAPGRGLRK